MKRLLTIIFVLTTCIVNAQNKKAVKLFDKGVEAFYKKDFKTADSLLTLSAKLEPNKDTYFILAFTKEKLGDHCSYCDYLDKAAQYGHSISDEIYRKNCITKDTIKYVNNKEAKVAYYCVSYFTNCTKIRTFEYYKKNQINNAVVRFEISPNDTFAYKEEDVLSPDFEIEKVTKIDDEKEFDKNTEIILDSPPFITVDEMPQYPGGDAARIKFISENIVYPKNAKKKGIEGTVYITFIVEPDGTITKIKILRGIGGGCDEECVRIIKLMPKWNPGKKDGKAVRVQFNLPIKFTLQ